MKILITGYGKMGRMVEELAQQKGWEILAALDGQDAKLLRQLKKADVAVDFSHPAMLEPLANYIRRTGTPLISGTTGYSEEQMDVLRQLGKSAAVLYSANYSLGVALLRRILENFGPMLLADFDVELVEKHHNQKIDAPSGTALMLADALASVRDGETQYMYDRHAQRKKREKSEIGIHSVRGGTIVGEHEVIFAGNNEVITLSHSAQSKELFAVGAVNAAVFMSGKGPGLYDMSALV